MFKGIFLISLIQLLSSQVSGTRHHMVPITSIALPDARARNGIKWTQKFDILDLNHSELRNSALSVRGGGLGLAISDLNNYIGSSKARSWGVLAFSIVADAVCVTLMKIAQEEGSAYKMAIAFFGFFLSLAGFAMALKSIDVSIAYAIWASVGTAIVSVSGVVFFGERLDLTKILCLTLILVGVVGLELTDEH